MTHQFDDFDTQIQSDELRQGEFYDEYMEWMEGEELDVGQHERDYDPFTDETQEEIDSAFRSRHLDFRREYDITTGEVT